MMTVFTKAVGLGIDAAAPGVGSAIVSVLGGVGVTLKDVEGLAEVFKVRILMFVCNGRVLHGS